VEAVNSSKTHEFLTHLITHTFKLQKLRKKEKANMGGKE
jgi:hypothetical protein